MSRMGSEIEPATDEGYGKDGAEDTDWLEARALLRPPAHTLPRRSHPTMRHTDAELPVVLGWPSPHLSLSNFENSSSLYEILQLIVTGNCHINSIATRKK